MTEASAPAAARPCPALAAVLLLRVDLPPSGPATYFTISCGEDRGAPATGDAGCETVEAGIDVTAAACGTVTQGAEAAGGPGDSRDASRLLLLPADVVTSLPLGPPEPATWPGTLTSTKGDAAVTSAG